MANHLPSRFIFIVSLYKITPEIDKLSSLISKSCWVRSQNNSLIIPPPLGGVHFARHIVCIIAGIMCVQTLPWDLNWTFTFPIHKAFLYFLGVIVSRIEVLDSVGVGGHSFITSVISPSTGVVLESLNQSFLWTRACLDIPFKPFQCGVLLFSEQKAFWLFWTIIKAKERKNLGGFCYQTQMQIHNSHVYKPTWIYMKIWNLYSELWKPKYYMLIIWQNIINH